MSIIPKWLADLKDQRVKVGDSLIYSPGLKVNTYGYVMKVAAILGDAFRFSEYDPDFNLYRVNGLGMTNADIGMYMIKIDAVFSNSTFSEHFSGHFWLTVWNDVVPVKPWFPEDPIEYPHWNGTIRENMMPEPFDPLKPIPFIKYVSRKGEMVIGWDKEMVPPGNYTEIPTAQVAVRSWDEVLAELHSKRRVLEGNLG